MPFELWGAAGAPQLSGFTRPLAGGLLLLLHLALLAILLPGHRLALSAPGRRQRLGTLLLALAALPLSQFLVLTLSAQGQLAPLATAENPSVFAAVLGSLPVVLAAGSISPTAGLLVGFSSGLGRALWQTHQLFTPFQFALAGLLAGRLMVQPYAGRLYGTLRRPIVAAPLSLLLLLPPLVATATFATARSSVSSLAVFDLALSSLQFQVLPAALEGIVGGLLVAILWRGLPALRPAGAGPAANQPSPQSRSLRLRLLTNFLLFAISLTLLLLVVVYNLGLSVATQLVVNQMGHNAAAVSQSIPDFLANRQNLLAQFNREPSLLSGDQEARQGTLRHLFRTAPFFRRVLLVQDAETVVASYPPASPPPGLSSLESSTIVSVLAAGSYATSPAQFTEDDGFSLSFVTPLVGEDGQPQGALVGRAPEISLLALIGSLQGAFGQGRGFLVDEQGQIIAHPDPATMLTSWSPPGRSRPLIAGTQDTGGIAYEGRQPQTNARELVYYIRGTNHPWTVVTTVPYEVVLRLALQIAAPLTAILAVAMAFFALNLAFLGRAITQPLQALSAATQDIAAGNLQVPITTSGRPDEIGQLSSAFQQMQRALRQRMDDLSLLLSVSQDVSASIDIAAGMPALLQGALRVSGAAGARMVVLNPLGSHPLLFGEGPAAEAMAAHDRALMGLVRQSGEVQLSRPQATAQALDLPRQDLAVRALMAMPLQSGRRFLGIFWLGFRQRHDFSQRELDLLHTLAGQASVHVENGWLYTAAESERRRLAAVLSSTADAVLATDQTGRVLLANQAFEKAFRLRSHEVKGRRVAEVIRSPALLQALTEPREHPFSLEIADDKERMWLASVYRLVTSEGQGLGQVAVLHDITALKEVDELKSEFVHMVSHSLTTPLTYMRNYAAMLPIVGRLNPKQAEYVAKIAEGIDRMSELVKEVLDVGRIEAGIDLLVGELDLKQMLGEIAREFEMPAAKAGLELRLNLPPTLPPLEGDGSLLHESVSNLVSNAIKYAPNSGPLELTAVVEDGELLIKVQDRGPGIPPEEMRHLFSKFHRVKSRRGVKGYGLGLVIVRTVAERHGGRAWCESKAGQGSTFIIALPLQPRRSGSYKPRPAVS